MTLQEMFNKAYLGVIKQGGPAAQRNPGTGGLQCSYLTSNGLKCNVGHLMSEEQLAAMGGFMGGVESLHTDWRYTTSLPVPEWLMEREDRDFLAGLQDVHDNLMHYSGEEFVNYFKHDMAKFAYRYNLTVPELEQE
jgi:hypothetical protein